MIWDNSFETLPLHSDLGAVTNISLRNLKEVVYDYLIKQHTFDLAATSECLHIQGLCTIVNVEINPLPLNVVGALGYDKDDKTFLRDLGAGLGWETIGGTDHGSLSNLSDNSCHSIYLLRSGGDITSVTVLPGGAIEGLSTVEAAYTSGDVMPYALHIGDSGGAKHSDNVVEALYDISLTYADKIKSAIVEDGPASVGAGATREWIIGRMAFMPLALSDMIRGFDIHPLFNPTPPDNWDAGFTFRNNSGSSAVFHMNAVVTSA